MRDRLECSGGGNIDDGATTAFPHLGEVAGGESGEGGAVMTVVDKVLPNLVGSENRRELRLA